LAAPRVKSEHCIGIFKGRFPFLKNIRMKISKKKHLKRIIKYVRGAVVLHNSMIGDPFEEEWIQDEQLLEVDTLEEEATSILNIPVEDRRSALLAYFGELPDINIY
jgi:hypothetical protein